MTLPFKFVSHCEEAQRSNLRNDINNLNEIATPACR